MKKKLAKIRSASLEIKDRGILNFWIHVDYEDGYSQGVGGIALDKWDDSKQRRVGTSYGCEVIRQLLMVTNTNDFSEMCGKMIWVLGEGGGLAFRPTGIQALQVDCDRKCLKVLFDDILQEFGED